MRNLLRHRVIMLSTMAMALAMAASPLDAQQSASGKSAPGKASVSVHVTPDNFVRAESDGFFKQRVDAGMFGKLGHVYEPTPIDKQGIVRMNRDTLLSWGIFDVTAPVTIVKPDTGKRFQSMVVLNEDHYVKLVATIQASMY
jgi:hypothetical protein